MTQPRGGRGRALLVLAVSVCLLSVLSQAVIAAPVQKQPDLRGAWQFDEGTGTIASDRSAYKNDGVIQGATWVPGRIGTALFFDGQTDRVIVSDSAALEPAHVSLSLWFRISSQPGRWRVLAYKGVIDCFASSYSLKGNELGTGLVFMAWNGTANYWTPAATGVWDGQWHHAVGTFDGSALQLYIDGALVGSTPMPGSIKYGLANGDDLVIGHPANLCGDTNPQYTGDIDEVQVWSRALSEAEIAKLAAPNRGKK